MAGSSGNWFKTKGGVKNRVFISNAVIAALTGQASVTPADMREAKAWLRDNADDAALERLAGRSYQPAGQAKEKILSETVASSTPPDARPAVKASITFIDEDGSPLSPVQSTQMAGSIGEALGLGRAATSADIGRIVGVLDGAKIEVSIDPESDYYNISVRHPLYTSFRQLSFDGTEISNVSFDVSASAPPGVATRVVARQMDAAAEMGISAVSLIAAGSKNDANYNGYYTWPRLGFDAKIPYSWIKKAPPGLRSATSLLDLFARPGGPEWWKEHGDEIVVTFDPTPGSPNRKALQDYLDVKGIDPYAPFP